MSWMAWTLPSAIFFGCIASIIILMTILEIKYPCTDRKGFLPISTTRGDRLFISLLSAAYIQLGFAGLSEMSAFIPLGISVVWLTIVMRWG